MLKQHELAGWWTRLSLGVCAFTLILIGAAQAYQFTDAQIDEAIVLLKPRHRNNPQFFGYVFEELVRRQWIEEVGRACYLSPNLYDPLRDVICPGKSSGRPIQLQIKAGSSATSIAKVCDALRTGRYSGAQLWLAQETHQGAMTACGALVRSRGTMVRKINLGKTRVVARIAALDKVTLAGIAAGGVLRAGDRLLRWIPFAGTAIGAAVTAAETYEAVTDPTIDDSERVDRGIATASEGMFKWGTSAGTCALTIAMLPSAPIMLTAVASVGSWRRRRLRDLDYRYWNYGRPNGVAGDMVDGQRGAGRLELGDQSVTASTRRDVMATPVLTG